MRRGEYVALIGAIIMCIGLLLSVPALIFIVTYETPALDDDGLPPSPPGQELGSTEDALGAGKLGGDLYYGAVYGRDVIIYLGLVAVGAVVVLLGLRRAGKGPEVAWDEREN